MVLVVSLGAGSYFVLRYLGYWSGNDTAVFNRAISDMLAMGSLTDGSNYPHGFAFSVWSTTVAHLTGIAVTPLTQLYGPLLGVLLVGILGFASFRVLLRSDAASMVAVGLLFLTPELLFSVTRGNHEKLTLSLTLLAITALAASFVELFERRRWRVLAGWVVSYYLTAFTLVSLNVFFGSSFIIAATIGLFLAFGVGAFAKRSSGLIWPVTRRLVIPVATSWVFVALVMFFAYPSAGMVLGLFETALSRIGSMVLALTPEVDPYVVTRTDWRSPLAYQALSAFRWILFGASFAVWLGLLANVVRRPRGIRVEQLFLTALYGAFGLQLAMAVVVDLVGLEAGSNLQVRLYAYFVLLAAPLAGHGLVAIRKRAEARGLGRTSNLIAVGLMSAFALMSVFKGTLDPAFSNRWLFYRPNEVEAIRFWDERLAQETLWVGSEARLRYAYVVHFEDAVENRNALAAFRPTGALRYALWTPLVEAQVRTWGTEPPAFVTDQTVFDNGGAQISFRSPNTPFQ